VEGDQSGRSGVPVTADRRQAGATAPFVSVVMPVRDEAAYIERSLGGILAQDWPAERLEVIVADGRSTDDTRRIVTDLANRTDVPVTLVDNPHGIVPTGLNRALEHAHGDVVIRVDGHCEVRSDFIGRLLDRLAGHPEADCVGGVLRTVGTGAVATAIATAQSSRLGVGSATFRTGAAEVRPVDTVAFGAYRRATLDRLGPFDEELVRNQDDEYNLRLTQAGGTILLDPAVEVIYHARGSLRGLWRQYRGYGTYKVRVLQKRGALSSARQLAPPALVAGLVGGVLAGVTLRRPVVALAGPGAYATGVGLAAVGLSRRAGSIRQVPLVAAALASLHLSYGWGFLGGLWRYRHHRSPLRTLAQALGLAHHPAGEPVLLTTGPRPR
jgi:GT2 family glycosyltransferase